jgi:hypothetical protein
LDAGIAAAIPAGSGTRRGTSHDAEVAVAQPEQARVGDHPRPIGEPVRGRDPLPARSWAIAQRDRGRGEQRGTRVRARLLDARAAGERFGERVARLRLDADELPTDDHEQRREHRRRCADQAQPAPVARHLEIVELPQRQLADRRDELCRLLREIGIAELARFDAAKIGRQRFLREAFAERGRNAGRALPVEVPGSGIPSELSRRDRDEDGVGRVFAEPIFDFFVHPRRARGAGRRQQHEVVRGVERGREQGPQPRIRGEVRLVAERTQ